MRYLLLFMLLFALFMFGRGNGCHFGFGGVKGEGPMKTETRDLSRFNQLTIDISGNIIVEPSETFRVEVSAQESLLPILKTEVEGDKLRLYFSENVWSSGDVNIKVYAPNLDGIALNGSADVDVRAPLRGEKLDLDVNGSGNIRVDKAEFGQVRCDVNGSGTLRVAGSATDLNADISGSGHIDALNLPVQNADADISGSGSVDCDVAQSLRASVSGSGDVRYRGAASVNTNVSGSGSVSKM